MLFCLKKMKVGYGRIENVPTKFQWIWLILSLNAVGGLAKCPNLPFDPLIPHLVGENEESMLFFWKQWNLCLLATGDLKISLLNINEF